MTLPLKRTVEVDADWFFKLEEYLLAYERFTDKADSHNLVLVTPEGYRIIFVMKKEPAGGA